MKSILAVFILTCTFAAQDTLWVESFETDGNGSRYTLSNEFNDGTADHYGRTDGSDISGSFTGLSGSFFISGEDLDDDGGDGFAYKYFTSNPIDVSAYTSLQFSGLFGANSGGLDASDTLSVQYSTDGGSTYINLISFHNESGFNNVWRVDTDNDGIGDGVTLTTTLAEFTATIPDASSLIIRVAASVNAASEEFAFDRITVTGTALPSGFFTSNLVITSFTDTLARFGFATESNGDAFLIYSTDSVDFQSGDSLSLGIASSFTDSVTGLIPNTRYFAYVRSVSQIDLSENYSDTISFRTDSLRFISGPVVISKGLDSLNIGWTNSVEATARVVYGTTSAYGDTIVVNNTFGDTVTITGLTEDTQYHYAVQLIDYSGTDTIQSVDATERTRKNVKTRGLIFSEYIEGSSNNKAIEIYNGTAEQIDLADYAIALFGNGSGIATQSFVWDSSLLLEADSVYVIANSTANAAILAVADTTSSVTFFNGDDALALMTRTNFDDGVAEYIDIIGFIGEDPGTAWGSGVQSTAEHTLRRRYVITEGDSINDAFDPADEWVGYAQDNSDDLGRFKFEFLSGPTITSITGSQATVNASSDSATVVIRYGLTSTYGDSIEITTAATSFNQTISGLTELTLYHYNVTITSSNSGVSVTSADDTFTTTQIVLFSDIFAGLYGRELIDSLKANYTPSSYAVDYAAARDSMFNSVDNFSNAFTTLYTNQSVAWTVGSGIPDVGIDRVNTEHIWPRSLGATASTVREKDIHHLAPTFVNPNAARGNYAFAEIDPLDADAWYNDSTAVGDPGSNYGDYSQVDDDASVFEPLDVSKGNVARAMFYFYSIYGDDPAVDTTWFSPQIATLQAWHDLDIPDDIEWLRMEEVAGIQGNTNPFLVDTTLADRIFMTVLRFVDGPTVIENGSDSIAIRYVLNAASEVRVRYGTTSGVYTDSVDISSAITDTVVLSGLANNTEYFIEFETISATVDTNVTATEISQSTDAIFKSRGLFFSEYVEGSGNNKALEIYNGTGQTIDLQDFAVSRFTNGATTIGTGITWDTETLLQADSVYVIANTSASAEIQAVSDTLSGTILHNGDDAYALMTRANFDSQTAEYIDVFGNIGEDPGSAWVGGTPSVSTANRTLRRKFRRTYGDSINGSFDPSIEWTGFANDYVDDLGRHIFALTDGPTESNLSATGITISFDSDSATAVLRYGLTTSYTDSSTFTANDNFSADLSGLSSGAVYQYEITITAKGGDRSYTTAVNRFDLTSTIQLTDVPLPTQLLSNDQAEYTALVLTLNSDSVQIDSLRLTQVASSDLSNLANIYVYQNGVLLDSATSITATQVIFDLSIDSLSAETANDTLEFRAKFNSLSANETYQFELSQTEDLVMTGSVTDNTTYPLTGRTLSYSQTYNVATVSSGVAFTEPGETIWVGYISIDRPNLLTQIIVQNRVASMGTVDENDIDSVYVYATVGTSNPVGQTPTVAVEWSNDGAGGFANVTFSPSETTESQYFHFAYVLNSGAEISNRASIQIDTLTFLNTMSLSGSFPLQVGEDVSLPVQFSSLTALNQPDGIQINVQALSSVGFTTIRMMRRDGNNELVEVGTIETDGSQESGYIFSFVDRTVEYGETVTYELYEYDQFTGKTLTLTRVPDHYDISNAYPNPFNPTTTVNILLPEASIVELRIFNVLGQVVYAQTLTNVPAGQLKSTWNGRNLQGQSLPSGMYFMQVQVRGVSNSSRLNRLQKIILLK